MLFWILLLANVASYSTLKLRIHPHFPSSCPTRRQTTNVNANFSLTIQSSQLRILISESFRLRILTFQVRLLLISLHSNHTLPAAFCSISNNFKSIFTIFCILPVWVPIEVEPTRFPFWTLHRSALSFQLTSCSQCVHLNLRFEWSPNMFDPIILNELFALEMTG